MTPLAGPPDADPTNDALADLVEELTGRLQAGEPVDPDAVARAYPAYAPQLRELLPALQALAGAADPSPRPLAAPLGELGDFRLRREIGRGGMGVVYEAEQISLNRRVALKVLPFAAVLDGRQLQRFKTEAQAAARLHHPHIVPVYAVGCERGVHYYAMQLIDGQSLAETIGRLRQAAGLGPAAPLEEEGQRTEDRGQKRAPLLSSVLRPLSSSMRPAGTTARDSPLARSTDRPRRDAAFYRAAAELGVQAAEALDYAHQAGVVHRDVKPANLLIDDQGTLWVTDFGLVRCAHGDGPTATGELLGTLRYMSPEQASARRGVVDHRTDVYALGATLYELLTLEPVFTGRDRRELLAQVVGEEPRPPRRLNPAVPAALETVVLKALAKEPAERYATAAELADDLRRFLDDKPVLARRPSLVERVGRRARRHRTAIRTAAVVGLLAAAAGALLLARQRDEAEARRRETRAALDTLFTGVVEQLLAGQPQLEPPQRDYLRTALGYYESFARDQGRDPDVRLGAAQALRRVGDIRHRLGEHGPADEAYARACEQLRRLAADEAGRPDVREEWAVALCHHGSLLRDLGRPAAARAAYRQSRDLFADLAAAAPDAAAYRQGLAGAGNNLGALLLTLGRPDQAIEAHRPALDLLDRLAESRPDDPSLRHDQAAALNNLGFILQDAGRWADAEAAYRRALGLWDQLPAGAAAAPPKYEEGRTACLHNLGGLLAANRPDAALQAYQAAADGRGRLAERFPRAPGYQQNLAASRFGYGQLLAALGRFRDAQAAQEAAFSLRNRLATAYPEVPAYRRDLAASHHGFGELLSATGHWGAAEQAYRAAVTLHERLASECPDLPAHHVGLSASRRGLSRALTALGQPARAEDQLRRALAALDDPAGHRLGPAAAAERAAVTHARARLLQNGGRAADADATYRRAVELAEGLVRDCPEVSAHAGLLAGVLEHHGTLLHAQGRGEEAAAAFRRSLDLRRQLAAGPGASPGRLGELAGALTSCPDERLRAPADALALAERAVRQAPQAGGLWARLGAARYRAGDWPGAVEALETAGQLRAGGECADWLFLAMAHHRRGDRAVAGQWLARAEHGLSAHPAPDEAVVRLRAEAAAVFGP
jgi:serine/threonine protein kinase